MPRFDLRLSEQSQAAMGIVRAGEISSASGPLRVRREWTTARLEALYEYAFLRVFATWEMCLEGVFYRSLCGFASAAGQESIVGGRSYFRTVAAAEQWVSGRPFLLWHDPQKVIDRCQKCFSPPPLGPCQQEITITSNLNRLGQLSATRHRIVHTHQADAKKKFDRATLSITGRIYPASRPGKFLRDRDTSSTPNPSWLEVLASDVTSLVRQMV